MTLRANRTSLCTPFFYILRMGKTLVTWVTMDAIQGLMHGRGGGAVPMTLLAGLVLRGVARCQTY
jgi:hypothetical protein